MADTTTAVSPLRRRMIDDMSLRNLSPATQRSYLHTVTKFRRYFGRSPDRLGLEDVQAFQVYLVSQASSLSTTAHYTQVATTTIASTQSPLDRLTFEVVPPA